MENAWQGINISTTPHTQSHFECSCTCAQRGMSLYVYMHMVFVSVRNTCMWSNMSSSALCIVYRSLHGQRREGDGKTRHLCVWCFSLGAAGPYSRSLAPFNTQRALAARGYAAFTLVCIIPSHHHLCAAARAVQVIKAKGEINADCWLREAQHINTQIRLLEMHAERKRDMLEIIIV
jgi:hypothetical protein